MSDLSAFDLKSVSHRGLTGHLIPGWLEAEVTDLDGRIQSSAYGETPPSLLEHFFRTVEADADDLFFDLGAGAGNLIICSESLGVRAVGFERNPELSALGKRVLESAGLSAEALQEKDFNVHRWPSATLVYAAAARFDEPTVEAIQSSLLERSPIRAVAFLGRSLDLEQGWKLVWSDIVTVRWNRDEEPLRESMEIWLRPTSFNFQHEQECGNSYRMVPK